MIKIEKRSLKLNKKIFYLNLQFNTYIKSKKYNKKKYNINIR